MIYHEKAPGVEDSLADKLDVYSRPGSVRAREVNHRPVRSKEEADSQYLALFDKVKNFKTAEQLKQAELYPYFRTISVHRPNASPVALDDRDTLTADPELPGFSCPVADFFR